MKIYCLLLDAVPWGCGNPSDAGTGRGGGLAGIAQRGGLTGLTQITAGMFTTTTLLSMFSGRLPSDLVTGGVGYLSHAEDRYYEWMKDQKINLIDLLKLAGFEVRLHHHLDFLLRMLLGFRGKDAVAEFEERQAEGDLRYSHVTLSSWDPAGKKLDVFSDYSDREKCAEFYTKETAYIKALQADKSPQNMFFLTQQQDWHDAWYTRDKRALGAARARTEQWLDQWDFTEPDSVFWIFSDHGYQVGNDVTPKDAFAWVLFRDNTGSPLRASRSIISSLDFYATMLHKAGLAEYCKEARDSIAMHLPASPSRVYLGEDSRVKADARFACSSVVSCVSRWVTAEGEVSAASAAAAGADGAVSPATLLMLVYHAQQGTVRAYSYDFLHENPYAFDAVELAALLLDSSDGEQAGVCSACSQLLQVLTHRFSWCEGSSVQRAIDLCTSTHQDGGEGGQGKGPTGRGGKEANDGEKGSADGGSVARTMGNGGLRGTLGGLGDGLVLLPNGMVLPARKPGVASR